MSQDEVALLLGAKRGSLVSRHELNRRIPTLETALAYEIVLRAPVRELFAGRFHEVEQGIQVRATRLMRKAMRSPKTRVRDRKVAVLRSIAMRRT